MDAVKNTLLAMLVCALITTPVGADDNSEDSPSPPEPEPQPETHCNWVSIRGTFPFVEVHRECIHV